MARLSQRQSEELQSLRRAYKAELPDKVKAVEAAALRLRERWDAERLDGVYHVAHRLAGSAAIYGFAQTSAAARALEAFVAAAAEAPARAPGAERIASLEALVAALRTAAAERS